MWCFHQTAATIDNLVLAMMLYAEVQAKAHEELDRVIGRTHMPDFSDEDNLPYIRAICTEVLRWRVVAPAGIPHRLTEDDEYKGMLLPKDSIIITNVW